MMIYLSFLMFGYQVTLGMKGMNATIPFPAMDK